MGHQEATAAPLTFQDHNKPLTQFITSVSFQTSEIIVKAFEGYLIERGRALTQSLSHTNCEQIL
jgi:hypothetical protein